VTASSFLDRLLSPANFTFAQTAVLPSNEMSKINLGDVHLQFHSDYGICRNLILCLFWTAEIVRTECPVSFAENG